MSEPYAYAVFESTLKGVDDSIDHEELYFPGQLDEDFFKRHEDAGRVKPLYTNEWQPIETAPKDKLIDIWVDTGDSQPHRLTGCYYDQICDEWRKTTENLYLITIKAKYVKFWMPLPKPPEK